MREDQCRCNQLTADSDEDLVEIFEGDLSGHPSVTKMIDLQYELRVPLCQQ